MPPKKKGAAGKAKATASTNKSTRSSGPVTPDTVTTKRGKEYDTTAAAARPRREVAPPKNDNPSTAPSRRAAPALVPSIAANTSKKRGRPAAVSADEPPAKKRGRPSKASTTAAESNSAPAKRGPGRPPKKTTAAAPATATTTGKKRGRPSKADTTQEPPKKRGRPSAASAMDEPAVPEEETAPPKRRGRPPKGGETTKMGGDDDAAAEQLEEELQDNAEELDDTNTRKRKAPASKKGKGKAPKTADDDEAEEEAIAADPGGKTFWLMKAEQDGHDVKLANGGTVNTTFTIDDLRSKTEPEAWDGVRSHQAANNMRAMKKGDLAFFYASGGKQGRKPGIVGIMEIVGEHQPDETTHDKNSSGYLEDEAQRDKWCVVHVEFRKKLRKPIYLKELQKYTKGGVLSNMQEFTAARLSVSKVTEKEWNFIVDELINGNYEEDDEEDDGEAAAMAMAPKKPKGPEDPAGAALAAEAAIEEPAAEKSPELPNGLNGVPIMRTTEADLPPTDFPDATSATGGAESKLTSSRPASRVTSRAASVVRKGSSRPASRAGSLAPPTGGRRGRSITPKPNTAESTMVVEEATVAGALGSIGEAEELLASAAATEQDFALA